jgi:hypothetical protein
VFGSKKQQLTNENALRASATMLEVRFGRSGRERSAATGGRGGRRTLRLRVQAEGALPYDADLILGAHDPILTIDRGDSVEVLVDPDDPQHIALAP